MTQFEIDLIINIIILIFTIGLTVVFLVKSKLESKGYKFFFIIYIVFWIPIMLTRPYRGAIQNVIEPAMLVWPLMAYGMVGIFIRPLADYLALKLTNRKLVLYFAAIIILTTFIPMIVIQTTATNIIQSIGIGIGASAIGTYELMFKEQYGKSKAFLTVSILAVPPLIADFITAPVQSIVRSSVAEAATNEDKLRLYSIMSMVALIGMVVFMIMLFFVHEKRSSVGLQHGNQIIDHQHHNVLFFATVILIGMLVLFIKFSNSGAAGTTQLQNLEKFTGVRVAGFEGYLSTVFSVSQLMGTFIFGFLSLKKVAKQIIFFLGIGIWIIYHLSSSFVANPYGFMAVHLLNGLAYGIIYNLLLGFILSLSFKEKIPMTPMGIYQSFLAVGVTFSGLFTTSIRKLFSPINNDATIEELLRPTFIINFIIIGILALLIILFVIATYLERKSIKDPPVVLNRQ